MRRPDLPPPDPEALVALAPTVNVGVLERQAEVVGPPKLFISYRRSDTRAFVEALDVRLREDLGARSVFRDVQDLIAGERFDTRIMKEIECADAVLVVIGPNWDGSTGALPSRLDDPDDFVRREVRAALDRRFRSMPIPLLVDGGTFPSSLPPDLRAIREHHYVEVDREQLARKDSPCYQRLLVAAWVAKLRSVPNGVILFGDDSPTARARLDELVEDMKQRNLIDVSQVSRYACGAQVLSLRKARNLARRFPSVIIVVDPESARSEVLATRVEEISRHRVGKVAVLAIGGGITFGAGVATGSGALAGLSSSLGSALSKFGATKAATSPSRLLGWHAIPTSSKVAAGALAVGLGGAGLAMIPLLDGDPGFALEGDWDVGTFEFDVTSGNPQGFRSFDGGTISFRNVVPDCDGSDCTVVVTDGPDFLRGARITPGDGDTLATTFAADETDTIRAITGGGITCRADDAEADVTDRADLSFRARTTDEAASADLEFAVVVTVPETETSAGACRSASMEWTASADKVEQD